MDSEQTPVYVSVKNGVGLVDLPQTKTVIGGSQLDEVSWNERDAISFYYRVQGQNTALETSTLGIYRLYPDQAIFSGNINVTEGSLYDCYAVYPQPSSIVDPSTGSGPTAVFNLPSTQNGLYDSSVDGTSCDIMVAQPRTGIAMSGSVSMDFVHKCHAFRIQVPTGRNLWGVDIKKLKIEFPAAVTGTLTVDMADPAAAPVLSEGQSTVWLDLCRLLNESETNSADGIYAWLFTAPVQLEGQIRFTAYNEENHQSESITVNIPSRSFEAGSITPINLTIPVEIEPSYVTLKITRNNIGEPYNTVTVTAPEGALLRNGSRTMVFEKNDSWEYQIGFYESYDAAPNNLEALKSAPLQVVYESDHAIFYDSISLADFVSGSTDQVFEREIPYILYQDFSGATGADRGDETDALDSYNLAGWSASNYGIHGGQGIEIRTYVSTISGFGTGDVNRGRIDSPKLTNLKEGSSVTLEASFDIGGTEAEGTNIFGKKKIIYATYAFGTDSADGAISYEQDISNIVVNYEDAGTDGNATNLPLHKDVNFVATRNDRLSWRSSYRLYDPSTGSVITGKTVYVYIDNIIVQVKSDNPEPLPPAAQ